MERYTPSPFKGFAKAPACYWNEELTNAGKHTGGEAGFSVSAPIS